MTGKWELIFPRDAIKASAMTENTAGRREVHFIWVLARKIKQCKC